MQIYCSLWHCLYPASDDPKLLQLRVQVIPETLLLINWQEKPAYGQGRADSNHAYFDSWIHLILVPKTFLFPSEDTEIFADGG